MEILRFDNTNCPRQKRRTKAEITTANVQKLMNDLDYITDVQILEMREQLLQEFGKRGIKKPD